VISTIAGRSQAGNNGDNGPATAAGLVLPFGLAMDSSANLYIADAGDYRVRKIALSTGIITTVAGNGTLGPSSGDGGPATQAVLYPWAITTDSAGNLFIADLFNRNVRRVDAVTGVITTVLSPTNLPSTDFFFPVAITIDLNGNLLVLDSGTVLRRVDHTSGMISAVAGNGGFGFFGDGGPAIAATLAAQGVNVNGAGDILIVDTQNNRIRTVSAIDGIIRTTAGSTDSTAGGDNAGATAATLSLPDEIAFSPAGDLYIADSFNHRVRKVNMATGIITTVAGNGSPGYFNDGGPAQAATLFFPEGLAFDQAGNLYIADEDNGRIRRVSAQTGIITTVAGSDRSGFAGDGGPATAAQLNSPGSIAVDSSGNLYVADTYNNRIRKVDAATHIITTIAGTGVQGFSGDTGPARLAALNRPQGMLLDSAGNLYFGDTLNNRIRKISAATGTITTVAGNGDPALMSSPAGIVMDAAGNLFISDSNNNRILRLDAATGAITTVAGDGKLGFYGDGGPATAAEFVFTGGLAISPQGDLFISDQGNSRIRAVKH
jgi:sugar lactone lactonase YvrE